MNQILMISQRSFMITLFLLLPFLMASGNDSLKRVTFNTAGWLKVDNLWLGTGNSSGLVFNGKSEVTSFDAGAWYRSGDLHLIREPEKSDRYSFSSSSYRRVSDKFFVAGGFSYNNINETGARWTGTYDPYRGNPYLLADSLSGVRTHKENYRISGQAAWKLSETLVFGTGIGYYVAVAAKQKDPRPEITVTLLEIHPSLLLLNTESKIGFDIGYSNRKEEISYTTYKSNFNPVFFMFKGFGFHSKEIDYGFYRFQTARSLTGGFQYDRNIAGFSSLAEIRGNYSLEKIEDGSSVIIREDGGDWKTWQVDLSENLKKSTGKMTHLIRVNLSFFNGDGIEYTQDVIFKGNHEEYITISRNLKFKRLDLNGGLSYNFLTMNGAGLTSWDILAGIHILNNREKYYYIPEIFTASRMNLSGNATVRRNFYTGKWHFAPSVRLIWSSGLSNSIFLSNLPEITRNQRPEIYLQEFDYYSDSFYGAGGGVQLGFSPHQGKSGQFTLGLNADYRKSSGSGFDNLITSATIGFVF